MTYVKRIVCLANSYKNHGSCIAGKEVRQDGYGPWIRPISTRPTAEVSHAECRYQNNTAPKVLDIIDVSLEHAAPQHHQTENHVIDTSIMWVKRGDLPWDEVGELCDDPASLWVNSQHTSAGVYDCISQEEAATLDNSLVLIRPESFVVRVGTSYWTGKPSYRGAFDYHGTHYNMSVTDPVIRAAFAGRAQGDYPVDDVYLCVSFTEPYEHDDRCHKLVAAVISNTAF